MQPQRKSNQLSDAPPFQLFPAKPFEIDKDNLEISRRLGSPDEEDIMNALEGKNFKRISAHFDSFFESFLGIFILFVAYIELFIYANKRLILRS